MRKHCDKGIHVKYKKVSLHWCFHLWSSQTLAQTYLKTFGGFDTLRQEQLFRRKFFQQRFLLQGSIVKNFFFLFMITEYWTHDLSCFQLGCLKLVPVMLISFSPASHVIQAKRNFNRIIMVWLIFLSFHISEGSESFLMAGSAFILTTVPNLVHMFPSCYLRFLSANIYTKKNIERCKVVLRYPKKKGSRTSKFMFNLS